MEKVGGLPASLFLVGRAVHSWLFAWSARSLGFLDPWVAAGQKMRDHILMFIPSGQDAFKLHMRQRDTHPQHHTPIIFSRGTCSVQDLIHALAFDIQAKESAALARYAYVSWDAPWCSHLFCHGTSLVLFILVLTSSPLLCGIL